jgi:hypothetical protein
MKHRVMIYYFIKAIHCYPQFGRFLGSHQTGGGVPVVKAVFTDIVTMNKYSNNTQQLTFFTGHQFLEIKYI